MYRLTLNLEKYLGKCIGYLGAVKPCSGHSYSSSFVPITSIDVDIFESGNYTLDAVFNGGSSSVGVSVNGAGWIVEIYEIE